MARSRYINGLSSIKALFCTAEDTVFAPGFSVKNIRHLLVAVTSWAGNLLDSLVKTLVCAAERGQAFAWFVAGDWVCEVPVVARAQFLGLWTDEAVGFASEALLFRRSGL